MTGPFPSAYYVYAHYDPNTQELLYIGHGWKHRAYLMDVPFRSQEHADCLNKLSETFPPDEIVQLWETRLSKEEACRIERDLIKDHKPRFNKIQGAALLKVTPEILEVALEMRDQGMSYSAIAETLNLAAMTIHRAVNGKSPALEEILERQS